MKIKISRIIKAIAFVLVAIMMINAISMFLTPTYIEGKWESASSTISFYEEDKNSIEVIFGGPSVVAAAVDPYQMYLEHGISSYNIAMISEPMMGTYFWIKECFETQNPKLVVIDPQTCTRQSVKIEEKFRRCYDYMKWGKNKLEFAMAYNQTDDEILIWDYLFPLSKFHSRWSQITEEDVDFMSGNNLSYARGYNAMTRRSGIEYDGVEDVNDLIPEKYNTLDCEYLIKTIEFCKEKEVPILLIRTPDSRWKIEKHNLIEKIIKDYDVPFVDYNMSDLYAELDMDFTVDGKDENHLGVYGAEKFTRHLGQYLVDNYDLTDYRGTKIGDNIEAGLDNYYRYINNAKMDDTFNLVTLAKCTEGKNYELIIGVSGGTTFNEDAKEILKSYGVDEKFLANNSDKYNKIGILTIGKDGNEFVWKKNKLDAELPVDLYKASSNGKSMSINMDIDGQATIKAAFDEKLYKSGINVVVYDCEFEKVVATFTEN